MSLLNDTSTQVQLYINSALQSSVTIGQTPFIDFSSGYTSILGAKYNSSSLLTSYYTGFINSFTVWNSYQSLASQFLTSCSGGCSICPSNGVCLPACDIGSYYTTSCQSCSSACKNGCVRNNDCNICYDRLCDTCTDYTSTGCSKCVDGASLVSGVCSCNTGVAGTKANGNLYCASNCMQYCLTCTSSSNGDCLSCISGYVLTVEGLCVLNCPNGYKNITNKCTPVSSASSNSQILHYIFNMTVNDLPDLTAGYLAFMGSSTSYVPTFDPNDPLPSYMRGLYFHGNAAYAQLPSNQNEKNFVILGNSHSIKFWLRPIQKASTSCILAKESKTSQYLYIYLDFSLTPYVSYQVNSINSDTSTSFTSFGKSLTSDQWQQLVIVFQRSGQASTATVFVNGIPGSTNYAFTSLFSEPSSLTFTLGYSYFLSTSFLGYIYELQIFNYAINPLVPSTCACGTCTETGFCLSSCPFNSFYSSNSSSCESCLPECTTGYVSTTTCGLNKDPMCQAYSGFEVADCISCIPLAANAGKGCSCVKNTLPGVSPCTCIANYENYNSDCVYCYYAIQPSDISSYFSQNYLYLVFNFVYPLQSSISSDCSVLFTDESLALFGRNPICFWNSTFTSLSVVLGQGATVVNETVRFKGNTLLTNIIQCGSYKGPLATNIIYKYSPPVVIPNAVIVAPYEYYLYCGNLILNSEGSSGQYGRPLQVL